MTQMRDMFDYLVLLLVISNVEIFVIFRYILYMTRVQQRGANLLAPYTSFRTPRGCAFARVLYTDPEHTEVQLLIKYAYPWLIQCVKKRQPPPKNNQYGGDKSARAQARVVFTFFTFWA